ncbi:hypothetical protein [Enterococcus sp. AZ109]
MEVKVKTLSGGVIVFKTDEPYILAAVVLNYTNQSTWVRVKL